MITVRWKTVKVKPKDAYSVRRVYGRLARMRGRGPLRHHLTVLVLSRGNILLLSAHHLVNASIIREVVQ
jgi:hypothetical protein